MFLSWWYDAMAWHMRYHQNDLRYVHPVWQHHFCDVVFSLQWLFSLHFHRQINNRNAAQLTPYYTKEGKYQCRIYCKVWTHKIRPWRDLWGVWQHEKFWPWYGMARQRRNSPTLSDLIPPTTAIHLMNIECKSSLRSGFDHRRDIYFTVHGSQVM